MALITDGPDDLNQGEENVVADLAFTLSGTGASNRTVLTGSATLPAIAAGEVFEIRDSSTTGNNGLYIETGGSPTTSAITCEKVVGTDPVNLAAESTSVFGSTGLTTEKSVHYDVFTKTFYLIEQGNLSADGITQLALHSHMKARWNDDQYLLDSAEFPMVGISFAAGQWIFGQDPSGNSSGWKPAEDDATYNLNTRRLIRNAGWDEIDSSGVTQKKYFNATTLGDFDNAADQAYLRFGSDATDTSAGTNFIYPDKVNEAVLYSDNVTAADAGSGFAFTTNNTLTRNDGGSWITEGYVVGGTIEISNAEDAGNNFATSGEIVIDTLSATVITTTGTPWTNNAADTTMTAAYSNANAVTLFLREQGKLYDQANLVSAGETAITSKIIKFPLSNSTDLDITKADPVTGDPWDEVRVRYLSETYNREVESTTLRDFGIVIDVGTYSQANGVSNGTTTFTSASLNLGSGEALADYAGGTLTIHDATGGDRDTHTISGTPTDAAGTLTIVLTSALTNSETSLSFTMDRATPKTATLAEIHEKAQYQLRQASDIDETANVVVGNIGDRLTSFVGPTFKSGAFTPANPNSPTDTGVIVEGFSAAERPNYRAVDNGGTERQYPFVSAGNLNFSQTLVDDAAGEYWLYFDRTSRVTGSSDISTVGNTGSTYDLEGTPLDVYAVGDYLRIGSFAESANNGLFVVEAVNTSGSDYTVRKVDGTAVGTAETSQSPTVDEHPYPSPQATIVNDNSGSPIVGNVTSTPIGFDFDWNGNAQEGRTTASAADVVLIASGFEDAQTAVVKGLQITESTSLSFSITAAVERNAVDLA